jgi:aconitate hydratase
MGILPLQFRAGESQETWGLTGLETYDILGLAGDGRDGSPDGPGGLQPGKTLTVRVTGPDGAARSFDALCRIDTAVELHYFRNGGILQSVLRDMLKR